MKTPFHSHLLMFHNILCKIFIIYIIMFILYNYTIRVQKGDANMGKKVLLISSDHTGHGHKSITESLCEKIKMEHDAEIHVVDGFSLGGPFLLIYRKIIRTHHKKSRKCLENGISSYPPIILNN